GDRLAGHGAVTAAKGRRLVVDVEDGEHGVGVLAARGGGGERPAGPRHVGQAGQVLEVEVALEAVLGPGGRDAHLEERVAGAADELAVAVPAERLAGQRGLAPLPGGAVWRR